MDDVRDQFDRALHSLMAKLQEDPCVLAAVLMGSLAYASVWERSDIDMLVVTQEGTRPREGVCLVEEGINVHCVLATRSEFRKLLEGSTGGSFMHSALMKGRMVFSKDEPLAELFEGRMVLGDHDRAVQMLRAASWVVPSLTKAQKWFTVSKDYPYCGLWLLKTAEALASVEALMHGVVPTREVLHQALGLNPSLFRAIYLDLIEGSPTPAQLEAGLAAVNDYLRANAGVVFAPIMAYLEEEGALRSSTDLNHHFARQYGIEGVDFACEWLADEGFLRKLGSPVRLTVKSHVSVEEAAYCLPGGESR